MALVRTVKTNTMKNLIFTSFIAAISFTNYAQLGTNLEIGQTIETLDQGVGIGVSAQYLFNITPAFHTGANGGFIFDFANGKEITSFSMPLLLSARYYLRGEHYLGGIYSEFNGGAAFHFKQETNLRTAKETYRFLPKANIGLGYRFAKGYDLKLHLNLDRVNQKTIPTLGVRFGYTFH